MGPPRPERVGRIAGVIVGTGTLSIVVSTRPGSKRTISLSGSTFTPSCPVRKARARALMK